LASLLRIGVVLEDAFRRSGFSVNIRDALNIVQILLAVLLVALVLVQAKGSGFSGMFGSDSTSVYRTRRGIEKRIFQVTIIIAVVFFVVAFVNSLKF
jgi:preprotein translocase subunit SecG